MLRIKDISIVQFRNYSRAGFRFSERIVGICGRNGVGKTNLLDALYYLCFTRSYFSRSDQVNVQTGQAGFRLEGHFSVGGKEADIVCVLRENGKKEFQVDGEAYEKLSHHIGRFPCVIIAPDDIQIVTGASEERRRFLDALLSQLDPGYLQALIEYNRVLLQRNSFLKSLAEGKVTDRSLLEVYDAQLVRPGMRIFEERRRFLQDFLPLAGKYYSQIAGAEEAISLSYESQLHFGPFPQLLAQRLDRDLFLQRTGSGPHRDDIGLLFAGLPFKTMASQGQRKSLLFALRLAEYDTLRRAKGYAPLLLLDDVFEKLDEFRMRNLLDRVASQGEGQIFITDTHAGRIREQLESLSVPFQIITL
ncbi:MAG TPA: DNA replication and repair protein RecF [Puia sp.]|nr:DNA replication and repair protein RecF [Puia sp.]